MTTSIRYRTVLRLSICSYRTTRQDIEVVFEKLREVGGMMDRGERYRLQIPDEIVGNRFRGTS